MGLPCSTQAPECTGSAAVTRGLSCLMGILVPRAGIKATFPALEAGFLTTEPPGKSLGGFFFFLNF